MTMKLKTLLAALALTTTPALAMAECSFKQEQVTMSCAEGTQWDAASQTCVPTASS
jgi:uncharacterized protein YdeI (BOF family)